MYSDTDQWLRIRHHILVEGVSRRQVVRDTGISINTVRKMLRYPQPVSYGPKQRTFPKLGPYMDMIRRMLKNEDVSSGTPIPSPREIYERMREQGYSGSCGTVRNYVSSLKHKERRLWEAAYDHTKLLDRRSAVTFLMRLARKTCSPKAQRALNDRRPCRHQHGRGISRGTEQPGSFHLDAEGASEENQRRCSSR